MKRLPLCLGLILLLAPELAAAVNLPTLSLGIKLTEVVSQSDRIENLG